MYCDKSGIFLDPLENYRSIEIVETLTTIWILAVRAHMTTHTPIYNITDTHDYWTLDLLRSALASL